MSRRGWSGADDGIQGDGYGVDGVGDGDVDVGGDVVGSGIEYVDVVVGVGLGLGIALVWEFTRIHIFLETVGAVFKELSAGSQMQF